MGGSVPELPEEHLTTPVCEISHLGKLNIKKAYTAVPQLHFRNSDHQEILLQPSYITQSHLEPWGCGSTVQQHNCGVVWRPQIWTFLRRPQIMLTNTQPLLAVISTGHLSAALPGILVYSPVNGPGLMQTYAQRSGTAPQLSSQGASWSIVTSVMSSKNLPRPPKEHTKKQTNKQNHESCRSIWKGIQSITGSGHLKLIYVTTPYLINIIFARFDWNIPLKSSGSPEKAALQVTHTYVLKALKQVNTCEDTGPDGVGPKVPKACTKQLADVYTDFFNTSLNLETSPKEASSDHLL